MKTAVKATFIIFIIMLVIDIATTLACGELVQYLEINPLVKYGGLIVPIVLNFIFIGFLFWSYNHNKNYSYRYFVILVLWIIIILRIFVAYSNYDLCVVNKPTLEEVQNIPVQELEAQKADLIRQVMILVLFMFVPGNIAFYCFRKDNLERGGK